MKNETFWRRRLSKETPLTWLDTVPPIVKLLVEGAQNCSIVLLV
jgi:hypothetical protein